MRNLLGKLPGLSWLKNSATPAASVAASDDTPDLSRRLLMGGGLAALAVTAAGVSLTAGSTEAEAGHGWRRSNRWGSHRRPRRWRRRRRRYRRHRSWRSNRYGYDGYGVYRPSIGIGGGGGPRIILDF